MVFLAPTKPLVRQQQEACHAAMGIPPSMTAEMTGEITLVQRKKLWETRRIFFMTPQVLPPRALRVLA